MSDTEATKNSVVDNTIRLVNPSDCEPLWSTVEFELEIEGPVGRPGVQF